MAVKSTGTTSTTESKNAAATPADDSDAAAPGPGECVVKADFHVGRAVPGTKVCSYHTMHYAADGTRRQ